MFGAFLLVVSLLMPVVSAQADRIIRLKRPVIGCVDKTDLGRFAVPDGHSQTSKPLGANNARCVRLSPGPIRIERVEGTYACVHSARYSCLWVRSEQIGISTQYDGAF